MSDDQYRSTSRVLNESGRMYGPGPGVAEERPTVVNLWAQAWGPRSFIASFTVLLLRPFVFDQKALPNSANRSGWGGASETDGRWGLVAVGRLVEVALLHARQSGKEHPGDGRDRCVECGGGVVVVLARERQLVLGVGQRLL